MIAYAYALEFKDTDARKLFGTQRKLLMPGGEPVSISQLFKGVNTA